jgi:signal transduction histidine kinase
MRELPDIVVPSTLETEARLDDYRRQLLENLTHSRDPGQGLHETELIGVLAQNIQDFKVAITPRDLAAKAAGPGELQSDLEQKERAKKALPTVVGSLIGLRGAAFGAGPYAAWVRVLAVNDRGEAAAVAVLADRLDIEDDELLQRRVKALTTNAADLRNLIYEQLEQHLAESRRHYQVSLWIVVPSSVLGLLLMAGLMQSFYAWVFYPIRDLEAGVKRVARGDFAHRIEVHSGDEMEDLGAAFNDMTQRLHNLYSNLAQQVNERSRQLVRSERLASVGFLAAGVAHEINNPLASIAFCSEALEARLAGLMGQLRASGRDREESEVFGKYLKMIQDEAFRCKNITERLLAFSRTGERREPADLGELVQSVLDITQHLPNTRGKHIRFEHDGRGTGGLTATVNAEEIKSVVLNLVVNALDSMEEGGRLTVRLGMRDGMAELQFTDTGCGMSRDVLENIFEPFFTRSKTGKGTGLGLTISHRIISQHGGEIEAASAGPNQGSTFTVRLPLEPAEAPEAARNGRPAGMAA